MTFVSIKMAEGSTPEQKEKLTTAIIEQVAGITHIDPVQVTVAIDEYAKSNWSSGIDILNKSATGESYDDLKKELRKEIMKIYERAGKECGQQVDQSLQFIQSSPNAVTAVKHLIKSTTHSFTSLWELGRLDLSLEALVVSDKYKELFSDEEIERCYSRLKKAGFFNPRNR